MNARLFQIAMVVSAVAVVGWGCIQTGSPGGVVVDLLLGWLAFAMKVWPRVQVDWIAAGLGVVAAVFFLIGLHLFLSWWVRATAQPDAGAVARRWKFRWSVACVGLILVAFAAGTALVGIAHQTVWAATSPQRLTQRVSADRDTKVEHNLFRLSLGISGYASTYHAGLHVENKAGKNRQQSAPHSWITAIAPFEGHWLQELHSEKPWNHPDNAAQFRRLHPSVLHPQYDVSTWRDADGNGLSHFAANANLMGPNAEGLRVKFKEQGAANTILVGQVAQNLEPWGKPANARDPRLGINRSPDGFGGLPSERGVQFLMGDGSVRFIADDVDPAVMRALGGLAATGSK